jgi:GGDEF domain-containing protein
MFFAPLGQGFLIEDNEIRVSARAGIALFPGDGQDADTLFKHAEAALKQAKASPDMFMFLRPEMKCPDGRKGRARGSVAQGQRR